MSEYTVKAEKLSLPLVALNTTVAFPGEVINLEIDDSNFGSCDALREAFEGSKYAVAIPIKDSEASEPILFEVGTVIKIKQLINAGEKTLRCIAEGMSRAMVSSYRRTGKYFYPFQSIIFFVRHLTQSPARYQAWQQFALVSFCF